MVFHAHAALLARGPAELIRILGVFNPDLPAGSLHFVSKADVGKGRVVVFLDVSKEGYEHLKNLGLKLRTPTGAATLCPVKRR